MTIIRRLIAWLTSDRRELPRMGWANANRIADDHAFEVARIIADAHRAVFA